MNHKRKAAVGACLSAYIVHNFWAFIPFVPTIIQIMELMKQTNFGG